MSRIYDINGETLTEGLQGSKVCDQAIIAARETAVERGEDVLLEDDDGMWRVTPDGKATALGHADMLGLGFEPPAEEQP